MGHAFFAQCSDFSHRYNKFYYEDSFTAYSSEMKIYKFFWKIIIFQDKCKYSVIAAISSSCIIQSHVASKVESSLGLMMAMQAIS